jgi:hypothetical protein
LSIDCQLSDGRVGGRVFRAAISLLMLGTVHNACLGIGVPPKSIVNQQTISNQQSAISNRQSAIVSVSS